MKNFYYHATAIEHIESIKKSGLKANEEGEIFVVNDLSVLKSVAFNQLFTNEYAVFKIDADAIEEIEDDDVAEFTSSNQFIIKQDLIEPVHLKLMGIEKHCPLLNMIGENIKSLGRFGGSESEAFESALFIAKRNKILKVILERDYPDLDLNKYKEIVAKEKAPN